MRLLIGGYGSGMGGLQLCEDAVEGCAGAAGGGKGEPWRFADCGGGCGGWMVVRWGFGRDAGSEERFCLGFHVRCCEVGGGLGSLGCLGYFDKTGCAAHV